MSWNGTIDGKLQPPGRYVLEIAAQDAAGNRSKPFPFAVVAIRYIALGRTNIAGRAEAPLLGLRADGREGVQLALRPAAAAPRASTP